MKSMMKSVLVLGVAVLAAVSLAQGGGGRGQGFRFGGGMNDASGVNLLRREDVQAELKITDDQKSKITAQNEAMRDKMREAFQNGGGGGDREAMMATMQKMQAENTKTTLAILNDDQKKRLKELAVQRMGNSAITAADLQKDLGVTDEQKTKIKELQDKQNEATQSLFEKMRNQEIDREQMQASMKKNTDAMNAELGKILTDAQKSKIKEMSGKPFTFKEEAPRGGGN